MRRICFWCALSAAVVALAAWALRERKGADADDLFDDWLRWERWS